MGTEISTFNGDEFIIEEAKFWDGSNYESNINKEETITSSNERNENKALIKQLNGVEEINKTSSTFDKSKSDYIPFKMITGSFLNDWNICIPMIRKPKTNIYEYQTSLSKQKHFFKYIINNKWKCSSLYPTVIDESNNVNNYIDLTCHNLGNSKKNANVNVKLNINIKDKNFNNDCDAGNYNDNDDGHVDIYKKKNDGYDLKYPLIKDYKKKNDGYDLKYPLIKDLNLTAPSVMNNYRKNFCLEYQSNQNKICELFLPNKIYQKSNYLMENNDYKKIFDFPNEKIDHLIYNIQDFHIFKKSIRFCTSERKREKLLTLIYYKPK